MTVCFVVYVRTLTNAQYAIGLDQIWIIFTKSVSTFQPLGHEFQKHDVFLRSCSYFIALSGACFVYKWV